MAPDSAHEIETSDISATLPLHAPQHAVSGTAWRASWRRCSNATAASPSSCPACNPLLKFLSPSSGALLRAAKFDAESFTWPTRSHAAGDPSGGAVVGGVSNNEESEDHGRYSCDPSRWSDPGHALSEVAKEAHRVKAVRSVVSARRQENGMVPGVFVGSVFIVHPLTSPKDQANWLENSSDGGVGGREDPRMLLCTTRISGMYQANKIMHSRLDTALQTHKCGNSSSRGISLSSFRDEGAVILKSAAAKKGPHLETATSHQSLQPPTDRKQESSKGSSTLSNGLGNPPKQSHPDASTAVSPGSDAPSSTATLAPQPSTKLRDTAATAQSDDRWLSATEGSMTAAVEDVLSKLECSVKVLTFLNHPSAQAMRLRAAATQLSQEASHVMATQGPDAAQPIVHLLTATLRQYGKETVGHAKALSHFAPSHAGMVIAPRSLPVGSAGSSSQGNSSGGQQGTDPDRQQPWLFSTSMMSVLASMTAAPASFRVARDASQIMKLRQTHVAERDEALAVLKKAHSRLCRQKKKGKSLNDQMADLRRRHSDSNGDSDALLPPRLRAMAIRFRQAADAEVNDSTAEDTLAAFHRHTRNGSRGLPAFCVPGMYVTVGTPQGKVRLTPMFLSRQTLDSAIAAARSVDVLSSQQPRRMRRSLRRKGAEARSTAVFADSLARLGISMSGSSGGSIGGKQRNEDDVPEADDLLAEMGMGSNKSSLGSGGSSGGLGGALVSVAATVALGSASLLAATWQAAGDRTDDALFGTGLSRWLPGFEMPVKVQAHLLQDYVSDCGQWNHRRRRQKEVSAGGTKEVLAAISSTATVAMQAFQELFSAEGKLAVRKFIAQVNESSMAVNDVVMSRPHLTESAATVANASSGNGSISTTQLNIEWNPAETFGLGKPEEPWEDVEQPDHLRGVIIVGDCTQHNTSVDAAHQRPPPLGVGDATFFAAEGYISNDDVN